MERSVKGNTLYSPHWLSQEWQEWRGGNEIITFLFIHLSSLFLLFFNKDITLLKLKNNKNKIHH